MKDRVDALRRAVLESWTLTQQRSALLVAVEAKHEVGFTRYGVADEDANVRLGPRKYQMVRRGKKEPEPVAWVPFAVLLDQFEEAVRAEEQGK